LNHWIKRPELRRHLEYAFTRGDIQRLPIELSLFARCTTPKQWNGYDIDNITNIYNQCKYRWINIEKQCQNYCLFNNYIQYTLTNNNSISSTFIQYKIYIIRLFVF
ncbi:unnamed protein product, partial [Rotaria sp. Silwood2]